MSYGAARALKYMLRIVAKSLWCNKRWLFRSYNLELCKCLCIHNSSMTCYMLELIISFRIRGDFSA